MKRQYSLLELCTGTGGFSTGFELTGRAHSVFANDYEKASSVIYKQNFPSTEFVLNSIHNLTTLPDFDILTCGFPCQSFSISGERKGFDDPRATVFLKTIEILKDKQPYVAVLENVKNLLTHDKVNSLKRVLESIQSAGYVPDYRVLDTAVHTCIPQHRERVYIICIRKDLPLKAFFPLPSPFKIPINEIVEDVVDDKYYYNRRFKVFDAIQEAVVKPISTNTLYQYRRTSVRENQSEQCPTLTANMGGGGHNVPLLLDDKGIRKLTPRECFTFQGFPSTYQLPEKLSDSALYKLAGNAITVPIIYSIATHLVFSLDKYLHKEMDELKHHELLDLYTHFKNYYMTRKTIYASKNKKHRLPNFPEDISENIVKCYIQRQHPSCRWNTEVGDLECDGKRIEVKCVNSSGPMSFSPTSYWDILYILKVISIDQDTFELYECSLTPKDEKVQQLHVSKKETFQQQREQKRRPRIGFTQLQTQLQDDLRMVWSGTLFDLIR